MKNLSKKIVSAILSSTLILPTLSPCSSAMRREKTPVHPKNTESQAINSYKIQKNGNIITFQREGQPIGRMSFYKKDNTNYATVGTQIKVIDDSEENNQIFLDIKQAKMVYTPNEYCVKIPTGTALYNAISKGGYKSEYLSYDKSKRIFNTENLCPVSKIIVYHYLNHKNYTKVSDISIWYAMYRILLCLVDGWNYEIIPEEDIIYICKYIKHFAKENSFDGLILDGINLNDRYIFSTAKDSLLYSLDIIHEKDSTELSKEHLAENFYVR